MEHQEPNEPELEKVWELLNSAKTVEPSPYFSRNVVREVRRLEDEAKKGWLGQISALFSTPAFRPVAIGVAACAAVAVTAVFLSNPNEAGAPEFAISTSEVEAESFDPASEMVEVEYFGQLVAVADPAMLDDASIANLFF